ncbi:MAG: NADPH:quinone oxidoreductase family protein [Sphingomonas sp.]|uniref:NADPH:quinone oxidoreductase family protein n=1 Tax=Sphingomonas sp. TaxID=28214 RepID=UPI001AC37568|nr:NADPH:quinone oxidoreductase family protein [Sphingomonas sp.]MBN8848613.1 NADPH:quinone oxidoreductase family protein [Sphingomonas sp.]
MKSVQAEKLDSVDDYRMVEIDIPAVASGDVLVQVATCGMGYVDALIALGRYQVKPPLPFVPGQEIGGTVVATGEGVQTVRHGDRVMAFGFGGGLAEYVAAKENMVARIPDAMTMEEAAIFRTNYLTALHGLVDRAAIAAGECMLVFGSAGGVGTAAIQIGRILGAEIIAAASTETKRAFALANGAQQTIDTEPDGWRDRLKALCDRQGPTVVFDPVCGPLFEPAFRAQAWGGRHLVVGFAGGLIPRLPVNLSLMKGAALLGVDVRQFQLFEPGRTRGHLIRLLEWVEEGRLSPPVGKIFPFGDYAAAMTHGLSGTGSGKAVVRISDDL